MVVHPTDPKTAWVCSPGDVWQPGERGIYKTTDGGKSWKKVYSAPAPFETRAGCGDLAIDPSDPNVLVRNALRASAPPMGVHLRRRGHRRQGHWRSAQEHRRRRDVDEARRAVCPE